MTSRLAVVAALATAAALLVTACDKNTPSATPTVATSLTPSATPGPTATTDSTASPKASTATTTAPPTGPRIVTYRIKTKANCQSHGQAVDYPGSVELEWEVTGGPTSVTISVDGPGIYNSYPIKHAEKYDFNCSEVGGKVTKHTYLLKTVGGGPVQQQTITAEATYH